MGTFTLPILSNIMRGKNIFKNSSPSIDAPVQKTARKGRNSGLLARRNECLVDRYYYYGNFTDKRFDLIVEQLSAEFFLSVATIPDIIENHLEQLQQLTQHLDTRVAAAIMRHHCHAVLSAAELQQLLQSQTDDSQQYGAVTIVSRRVVAVHELGASIWLSAPTCRCSCCHDDWEVLPAADVALPTHGCGSPISYCSIYLLEVFIWYRQQ